MISSISSLHTLFLAIVSVFVGLPSSNGVDDWYMTPFSVSFTRGNLENIGYPLSEDGRPRYCGHPVLQPWCVNDPHGFYPCLKIGPKDWVAYDDIISFAVTGYGYGVTPNLHGALEYYVRDFRELNLQSNRGFEIFDLTVNLLASDVGALRDYTEPSGAPSQVLLREEFEVIYSSFSSYHSSYSFDCVRCHDLGCTCESSPSSDFMCLCKPASQE